MIEFVAAGFRVLGVPEVARWLSRNRVAVLLYHDPSPEVFESHLEYLSQRYRFVRFSQVVSALVSGDWSDIPENALVIQFDDGYLGNAVLASLCDRFDLVPTLYLCSHVVGTRRRYWSKLAGGRSKKLRLVDYNTLLDKLRDEAEYWPDKEFRGREALSEEELLEMGGQFDFQSHGRYHFSAITMDDAELERELTESRDRVVDLTSQRCVHFSFPYGDYSERELRAVKDAGYMTARTTRPGWISSSTDPYQIPIVADVPGSASVNELRTYMTGIPRFVKRLIYRTITRYIYALRQRRLMARRFFQPSD